MNSREFQDRLVERGKLAGITINAELASRLEAYFRLLATWNAKINLTALPLDDAPPETLDRLLIEPVVAAGYVAEGASRMLDVGSGGGSPAIPLVLTRPELQLVMVESRTRKSVFLLEAIRALDIPHAEVATTRVEELLSKSGRPASHDLITMRAVRPDPRLMATLSDLLRPSGQLFLFARAGEAVRVSADFRTVTAHPLIADRSQLAILTPAER